MSGSRSRSLLSGGSPEHPAAELGKKPPLSPGRTRAFQANPGPAPRTISLLAGTVCGGAAGRAHKTQLGDLGIIGPQGGPSLLALELLQGETARLLVVFLEQRVRPPGEPNSGTGSHKEKHKEELSHGCTVGVLKLP